MTPQLRGVTASVFPFWSWLGWKRASEIDPLDPTARAKFRTFSQPLARWRKRNSRSGVVEDIDNSYYKWDKFAVTSVGEPPQGWTCTTSSGIEECHYQIDSIRRKGLDHYAHYSFYQPLSIDSGLSSPDNTLWDPLLFGIVHAAKLTIGDVLGQSQPVELYLYDSSGQWAGHMATCFDDTREYTEGDECFVIANVKRPDQGWKGRFNPTRKCQRAGKSEWRILTSSSECSGLNGMVTSPTVAVLVVSGRKLGRDNK